MCHIEMDESTQIVDQMVDFFDDFVKNGLRFCQMTLPS